MLHWQQGASSLLRCPGTLPSLLEKLMASRAGDPLGMHLQLSTGYWEQNGMKHSSTAGFGEQNQGESNPERLSVVPPSCLGQRKLGLLGESNIIALGSAWALLGMSTAPSV